METVVSEQPKYNCCPINGATDAIRVGGSAINVWATSSCFNGLLFANSNNTNGGSSTPGASATELEKRLNASNWTCRM